MDNSPLLKLSAEIRNEIYELVLCPPGGIQIALVDGTVAAVKLVHPPVELKICSLLATCREMRENCRPMLYCANFFQVNELSLPGETSGRKEAKDVRVQRYSECMKKLQGILPLIRKAQIDMGTWCWRLNDVKRSGECRSLAECCHALCDTISTTSTTMAADLKGQLSIDANDTSVYSADGHPADDAVAFTFVFDLRDLSTLSVTLVQQKFRAENQRLQTLRARGEMTLQEYSTEIVRLHTGRRRIVPLITEFVAMEPECRAQAPKPISQFGRESPSPGMTDDVATAAGDFHVLMARLTAVDMA
ncbi:hypothetical protein KC340_g8510 [Hortaea werneckii]|nr:hypothetical protein KC342_g8809 [Hortaea werneckii]KAI7095775.1 hypothetical protein KC339_g10831 [Hortaea werneckii]KAI7215157.1 hypothetical protein KC365_g13671 [Hortaea werneckii]KAI7316852.1 hypothetical protein KC340_g8510 [Hortaea werneckii]KAI7393740.1 hypothetical protein KC328_g6463 [Hortaea werneckii]